MYKNWNGEALPIESVKYIMYWWYECNEIHIYELEGNYHGTTETLMEEMTEDESCKIIAVRC